MQDTDKFQSLTLALDYISTDSPTVGKKSNRKPQEISSEAKRLLLSNSKTSNSKTVQRSDIKFQSFPRRTNLHITKVSDKGKEQGKSHQLRRIELKQYLEKLTQKSKNNNKDHTKENCADKGDVFFTRSDTYKRKKVEQLDTQRRHHKAHIEQLMRKVFNPQLPEIHSLPLITEISATQSPRRSKTFVGTGHKPKHEAEYLPSRLTSYGLSCLQDKVYKIDTSYRHAPYHYHSSSYGHPYVADELFERITEWIRTVNISVDWSSVVQSVSDEIVSIEQELNLEVCKTPHPGGSQRKSPHPRNSQNQSNVP